jgi:hypothetical protein
MATRLWRYALAVGLKEKLQLVNCCQLHEQPAIKTGIFMRRILEFRKSGSLQSVHQNNNCVTDGNKNTSSVQTHDITTFFTDRTTHEQHATDKRHTHYATNERTQHAKAAQVSFTTRRPEFDTRSDHVRFVIHKVALGLAFSEYFIFAYY